MPEVQTEVSGLSVVLKHCHKPQVIQPKATGFALRSLRIHIFPIESYSQRLLLRWKAAILSLCDGMWLGGRDSEKQMLVLHSIHVSDDAAQLSPCPASSTRVCCSADQRQAHQFIYKTFLFSMSDADLLTISSFSEWDCSTKWWGMEQGFGRAAGCWQFLWFINGHSKGL